MLHYITSKYDYPKYFPDQVDDELFEFVEPNRFTYEPMINQ
jgi:hypothetical protein